MRTLDRKPLDWFKVNRQVRRQFDEEALRRLGESIRVRQIQPVVASPDGVLLAGERRLRAGLLVGLKELLVVVTDEKHDETSLQLLQMTENLHREDLSDADKWRGASELLASNPTWKLKDLAEKLHLDGPAVTKMMSPSDCIKEVQQALDEGKVSLGTCYILSRLAPDQQLSALHQRLNGASRDDLEGLVRQRRTRASASSPGKRIQIPVGSITFSATSQSMTLDDLIEALGSALKEARRARGQSLDIKTWERVMRDRASDT